MGSAYKDDWDGCEWRDVIGSFAATVPEPDEVLLATYTYEDYSGSASVLYRSGEDYYVVEGSHCSCFGLEGQWEPEFYTLDTLIAAAERAAQSEQAYSSRYGFLAGYARDVLPALQERAPTP